MGNHSEETSPKASSGRSRYYESHEGSFGNLRDEGSARSTIQSFLRQNFVPVCGEAENGKQAVEKVQELRPEVVLLDIEMPVMNGIQAAYEIRRISPTTKILFFTIHKDEAVTGARLMGAEGYVTKSAAGTELIPALKRLVQAEY